MNINGDCHMLVGSGHCAAMSVLPIQWKGCVKEHMGKGRESEGK